MRTHSHTFCPRNRMTKRALGITGARNARQDKHSRESLLFESAIWPSARGRKSPSPLPPKLAYSLARKSPPPGNWKKHRGHSDKTQRVFWTIARFALVARTGGMKSEVSKFHTVRSEIEQLPRARLEFCRVRELALNKLVRYQKIDEKKREQKKKLNLPRSNRWAPDAVFMGCTWTFGKI